MFEKRKWKLIASSIIILLPCLFGLVLWNRLPAAMNMPSHWGADGQTTGRGGLLMVFFVLPLLLLALQWLGLWWTAKDPGNHQQSGKVVDMVLWLVPALSLAANGMTIAAASGREINFSFIPVLLGVMLVVIGNYMPKCTRNRTIGIKVKWALESEENWNATHRFAGRVWFAGGIAMMICAFLPIFIMPVVLIVFVLLPLCYSWLYYRKHRSESSYVITPLPKTKATTVSMVIAAVILIAVLAFVCTGDIAVEYGETAFTIKASCWNDLSVAYDAVESLEYRNSDAPGTRTWGFGGARVLMGTFQNAEFGSHTRYSYTSCDSCVVLRADGRTLVLNGPDAESTQAIYEQLLTHMK